MRVVQDITTQGQFICRQAFDSCAKTHNGQVTASAKLDFLAGNYRELTRVRALLLDRCSYQAEQSQRARSTRVLHLDEVAACL